MDAPITGAENVIIAAAATIMNQPSAACSSSNGAPLDAATDARTPPGVQHRHHGDAITSSVLGKFRKRHRRMKGQ